MKLRLLSLCIAAVLLTGASCSDNPKEVSMNVSVPILDLSGYSSAKPDKPVQTIFIHHSTGGQLLADKGEDVGENCIYKTHPNGGGLRKLLEENNYVVHDASYNSLVGHETDICHWNAKFRDHMEKILTCRQQDDFFEDGTRNEIVIFKSCFPNNWLESDGKHPGDPDSCTKTLANAQAAYKALLPYFSANPDTLFVVVTAPPMAKPVLYKKDRIIEFVKEVLGRPDTEDKIGKRARLFNNWLKDIKNGWLKDYKPKNVVVFDYYDVLTGHGKSDWSAYPTQEGFDSHPSSEGNTLAAKEFVPFLNRAYHWHRK